MVTLTIMLLLVSIDYWFFVLWCAVNYGRFFISETIIITIVINASFRSKTSLLTLN
jgi:hypothetical protein